MTRAARHRSLLISLLFVGEIASPRVQDSTVEAVWVRALPSQTEGQGFMIRTNRGCLLITAGHVAIEADSLVWRASNGVAGAGRLRFVRSDDQLDLAIFEPSSTVDIPCLTITSGQEMKRALESNHSEIRRVSQTGEDRRIATNVLQTTPEIVVRTHYPDEDVPKGTSGAPYLANSLLVGLVTSRPLRDATSLQTIARIQKLFDLPPEVAPWFTPPVEATPESKGWAPFDLEQLPPDIRNVVRRARETRRKAEELRTTAREVALRADNAAAIGRSKGLRATPHGYFVTDEDAADYAGGTKVIGEKVFANGYGVKEWIGGERMGQKVKCLRVHSQEGACDGAGVVQFRGQSSWQTWEGHTCASKLMCGLGVLTRKDSTMFFGDYLRQGPGVILLSFNQGTHTQRFEGETFEADGNGKGVIWDSSGTPSWIGEWKDGKFVKDRGSELRTRR